MDIRKKDSNIHNTSMYPAPPPPFNPNYAFRRLDHSSRVINIIIELRVSHICHKEAGNEHIIKRCFWFILQNRKFKIKDLFKSYFRTMKSCSQCNGESKSSRSKIILMPLLLPNHLEFIHKIEDCKILSTEWIHTSEKRWKGIQIKEKRGGEGRKTD